MKKMNEMVQYDFQRNTFYKINKETGAQSSTYKNGQILKRFRPEVTGQHYLIRRKSQRRDEGENFASMIKEKSFNTEKNLPQYGYFKTLDSSRRESKITEISSMTMRSTFSNKKKSEKLVPLQSRNSSILRNYIDAQPSQLSKQKSNQRLNKQIFNQTLSNYTKILKQKSRDNHSPKKDEYPAGQQRKNPLQTLCTTLASFKFKQPLWESEGSATERTAKREAKIKLSSDLIKKQMSSAEKSQYLQFHSQYKTVESPKSISIQKQRKKNLKILQDLFIRQNNKITGKIYKAIV